MAAYTDEDYRDLDSKAYYAKDNSKYTKKGYEFENKSTGNRYVVVDSHENKTYEKTGKLPQTGNESSMGMMLIGLVTLLLSLGLVVISRFTI